MHLYTGEKTEKSIPFRVRLTNEQHYQKGDNITLDGEIYKIGSIRKVEAVKGVVWIYGKAAPIKK